MSFSVENYAANPSQWLVVIMSGVITLNLLLLLVTVILNKLFRVRVCFSSIVASMTMFWVTFCIVVIFLNQNEYSPFTGALVMMVGTLIYSGYLFAMQPDTVEILAKKELRKQELRKRELEKVMLKREIKSAKKSNESDLSKKEKIDQAQKRLAEIEAEKVLVKQAYRKPHPLDQFFKRKVQKVIEKQ